MRILPLVPVCALLGAAASAEPMFISKQYTRCTTCHYSPTGGGLLTPYGRSLSRQELSTTGRSPAGETPTGHEEAFLFGALGSALGPVDLGFDTRPAHLAIDVGGLQTTSDLFLNADLLGAFRSGPWTAYAEVGREPLPAGSTIDSYEHWVSWQSEGGLGIRAGRFLPAYGVRLADHTAFTRANLGFDVYDQVYAVEFSKSDEHHLLQISLGPGRADSLRNDDGRGAFTATGRFQMDLAPRSTLVVSGLYRDTSTLVPRSGSTGLAYGFAPTPRVSLWVEGDAQFQQGAPGTPAYTLMNETAVEVYRGLWLKVSPQLRTDLGNTSGGTFRLVFEADLLPRTHWNLDVSYYRDDARALNLVSHIFLAQVHLYL